MTRMGNTKAGEVAFDTTSRQVEGGRRLILVLNVQLFVSSILSRRVI